MHRGFGITEKLCKGIWDEEYSQDIQEAAEAVDMAVEIIKNSNVCGTMTLNGETYIISKV